MKCLLVEPGYRAKFPNIGLMKISTKLKQAGNEVEYIHGLKKRTLDGINYDEIYITTLFTYESKITIDTINYYKRAYPNAEVYVGGALATLMPEYIEEKTGIKPFIGWSKELDQIKPDYDLIKKDNMFDNYSLLFTTRGCPNKCPFCVVPALEPEFWVNPNWKSQVDFRRTQIGFLDNNLTATPIEHFREVMKFCRKFKLGVTFCSGIDCRLFNEEHVKALVGVRLNNRGLRFAFDTMEQEEHIQRTLQLCRDYKLSRAGTLVWILFNFMDTPQEAEYRIREAIKFKVGIYPMQYTPIRKLSRKPIHIGKYWTTELVAEFRQFYHIPKWYRTRTFPEWLEIQKKPDLLEQFNKYPFNPHGKT